MSSARFPGDERRASFLFVALRPSKALPHARDLRHVPPDFLDL